MPKMVAVGYTEALLPVYQTTRCHIPEDCHPPRHRLGKVRAV